MQSLPDRDSAHPIFSILILGAASSYIPQKVLILMEN